MWLTAGGIRELHLHKADEWSLMLYGNCRLTALNFDGSTYVNDSLSIARRWTRPSVMATASRTPPAITSAGSNGRR
jgi:oxalate decarboxylase